MLALALTGPAAAGGERGKRIEAVFRSWASEQGVSDALLAAVKGPKILAEVAIGPRNPRTPQPVYGLSRPISTACAMATARSLPGSHRLGDLLKDHFERYPPADELAREVTYYNLVLQNYVFFASAEKRRPLRFGKDLERQFARGVARGVIPEWARDDRFPSRNDFTYVGIALIIETTMGRPFEDHCRDVIFRPIGIENVDLEPTFLSRGMWGAWRISISDYARFLTAFYSNVGPTHTYQGGAQMRVIVPTTIDRQPHEAIYDSGPSLNGSKECLFFVSWSDYNFTDPYSYLVSMNPCADYEATRDLKRRMAKAFFPGQFYPR